MKQHEEIKILVNDYVEFKNEEKSKKKIDTDEVIEILWTKNQRVQCLS